MTEHQNQAARLEALAHRAEQYLTSRGFKVEQKNGQRETINRNLTELPPDVKENEVFVGKLPRDLYEDELLPFMQQAGRVYKIRLMMDFGKTNRGYAFVRYLTPDEADRACVVLDRSHIRPREPEVGVLHSFDNKRLFFGNLPDVSEPELHKKLSEQIMGIQSVELHDKQSSNNDNRRYAFVTFKSHSHATAARRLLCPGTTKICGRVITVDWAKTEPSSTTRNRSPSGSTHSDRHQQNQIPPAFKPPVNNYNLFGNCASNINNVPDFNPFTGFNILGLKAQQMFNSTYPITDINNNINTNIKPTKIDRQYEDRILIIDNINPLSCQSMDVFKSIFELGPRLKITHIFKSGETRFTVVYETPEMVDVILETLLMLPFCFHRLAIPDQLLVGTRYTAFKQSNKLEKPRYLSSLSNIHN